MARLPPALLTADGERLSWRAYGVLVLLCLAFFLPGFFTLPPIDRDEPHFAQATKQMLETGNYVDIRFRDQPRYQKPVGIYWLQAASVKLFSPAKLDAIWAYRIPSLMGATVAVVMTAALGTLFFGPLAGFLAALLLAGCVVLNVEARLAKTDAALLGCIMVAQYGLARAYLGRAGFGSRLVFWTAQALAILIKGPILLLITLGTLLGLRVRRGALTEPPPAGWWRNLRPMWGLPYALLLTAPWFIAIMLASHGAFAEKSAGHDLLGKIFHGEFRGIIPPGAHLLAFPAIFFPASLLALLAIPDVWRRRHDPRVRFCLGWIVPIWLVFEIALTKLPHYVMPTYPAIAILAAKAFLDGYPALVERRWWPPVATGIIFLVAAGLSLGLILLPLLTDQVWNITQVLAGVLLLTALAAGLLFLAQGKLQGILLLVAGSLVFIAISFGITLPSLQKVWLSRQIMQVAESVKPCADVKLVSASYKEPSLVFLAGTDLYTPNSGEEAAAALKTNACLLGLVDGKHEEGFQAAFAANRIKPVALAHFSGPNLGSGRAVVLTLYRLPPQGAAP